MGKAGIKESDLHSMNPLISQEARYYVNSYEKRTRPLLDRYLYERINCVGTYSFYKKLTDCGNRLIMFRNIQHADGDCEPLTDHAHVQFRAADFRKIAYLAKRGDIVYFNAYVDKYEHDHTKVEYKANGLFDAYIIDDEIVDSFGCKNE